MRTMILAGAAALALATFPAIAQDNDHDSDDATATAPAAAPQQAPRSAEQANANAQPGPTTTAVAVDAATGASAVVTTFPGNVSPPSSAALNKHYPVCTRKLQDNCQNPGEGGAPGHSRALSYWPGKPASEGGR